MAIPLERPPNGCHVEWCGFKLCSAESSSKLAVQPSDPSVSMACTQLSRSIPLDVTESLQLEIICLSERNPRRVSSAACC